MQHCYVGCAVFRRRVACEDTKYTHPPDVPVESKGKSPVCIDITYYLKSGQLASISCLES